MNFATGRRRGPHAVNRELRELGIVLHSWRRLGLTPRLSRDDITDRLAKLKEPTPLPAPLKGAEPAALLQAALRHDAATFTETRAEHAGCGAPGTTVRYEPLAPLVAFLLLSGCRLGEARTLRWEHVDLDAPGSDGRPMGLFTLHETKTGRPREVAFDVSPTLRSLIAALKLRAGQAPFVFGGDAPLAVHRVQTAVRQRLRAHGAPAFTWQRLRQTTGAYLTNAPGIYGSASAYQSAARLGHSVVVAERHSVDAIRGILREARTLEAAMGIEPAMRELLARVGADESAASRAEG